MNTIQDYINEYKDGGRAPEDIRADYNRLVKPYERDAGSAALVKKAKEVMAYALKHAWVWNRGFTYKGLKFQGGGVQMPEGEPVDIEVYAGNKFLGCYGYGNKNPGRTPEEKVSIKEAMKKIGVSSRYIFNSLPVSTNAVVRNAVMANSAVARNAVNANELKTLVNKWVSLEPKCAQMKREIVELSKKLDLFTNYKNAEEIESNPELKSIM